MENYSGKLEKLFFILVVWTEKSVFLSPSQKNEGSTVYIRLEAFNEEAFKGWTCYGRNS